VANLILIPTNREHSVLQPLLADIAAQNGWCIELVGFGPIAAAARASQLIALHQPKAVCLIGIAGGFQGRSVPVGQAMPFESVACDGVGVGAADEFRGAAELGWTMIQHETTDGETTNTMDQIHLHDALSERDADSKPDADSEYCLLTVCAASANVAEANRRAERFPNAVAEDMEGFGVATSCRIANVPVRIVRGISNWVGDRDFDHWQIDKALQSAARLAMDDLLGDIR